MRIQSGKAQKIRKLPAPYRSHVECNPEIITTAELEDHVAIFTATLIY